MASEFVVDFPTLGDLLDGWYEAHCLIPDGFKRGKPFRQYDWQFFCTANYYRVRGDAVYDPDDPPLNQAFVNRRGQVVAAQKTGKGPWSACIVAGEAVGPSQFIGWAEGGEVYRCDDWGCPCGWEYTYLPGEPMGGRHPSPLIQCTARSQDQVDNVWRPLNAMVRRRDSPLSKLLLPREDHFKVVGQNMDDPELDRIDSVTSSAQSRLGNPISFALQDETGTWTLSNGMQEVADTQRRGAAGMSGRTLETTNCWDPSQQSVAQATYESPAQDIFRFWRDPDLVLRKKDGKPLSFRNKAERRQILAYVYEGCAHIKLDSINAEAEEILARDPAQAERFFGNRLVSGAGSWIDPAAWRRAYAGMASGAA